MVRINPLESMTMPVPSRSPPSELRLRASGTAFTITLTTENASTVSGSRARGASAAFTVLARSHVNVSAKPAAADFKRPVYPTKYDMTRLLRNHDTCPILDLTRRFGNRSTRARIGVPAAGMHGGRLLQSKRRYRHRISVIFSTIFEGVPDGFRTERQSRDRYRRH